MQATHSHTSFTVSDLDRSVAFYRDALGFAVERTFEAEGDRISRITGMPGAHLKIALLVLGSFRLELIQYLSPPGKKLDLSTNNTGASHIGFYVEDIQAAYNKLKAQGIQFRSLPTSADDTRPLVAYFSDPDGITLELQQRPKS